MEYRYRLPEGNAGARLTATKIRRLISEGRRDLKIRQLAERILRDTGTYRRPPQEQLQAIYSWARANLGYVRDPVNVEYVQGARRMLESLQGDCDCFNVLIGSLAESIGIPVGVRIVTLAGREEYHHVYPVAQLEGYEMALDATEANGAGWESPLIVAQETFYEKDGGYSMSGTGVYANLGGLAAARLGESTEERNLTAAIEKYNKILADVEAENWAPYGGSSYSAKLKLKQAERNVEIWARKLDKYEEAMRGMRTYTERTEPKVETPPPPSIPTSGGIVVPAGVFVYAQVPDLVTLDAYGVRGIHWPGISAGSPGAPSAGFVRRLIVDGVYPVKNKAGSERVFFVWREVPIENITESERPKLPATTDTCEAYALKPGELIASKGLFSIGDQVSQAWGSKFAKTSPGGKSDYTLKNDQVWGLFIVNVQDCALDRSVYTSRYKPMALPVEEKPQVELPPTEIVSEDITVDVLPDIESLYDGDGEVLPETPAGGTSFKVPTVAWIVGGLAAFLLLRAK